MKYMYPVNYELGDEIIKEGSSGDVLYALQGRGRDCKRKGRSGDNHNKIKTFLIFNFGLKNVLGV